VDGKRLGSIVEPLTIARSSNDLITNGRSPSMMTYNDKNLMTVCYHRESFVTVPLFGLLK
jgi:hypothetical protein